jgi:hypothetical protein
MNTLKKLHNAVVDRFSGERVVFHHLQKCGGTSIYRKLALHYPFSKHVFDVQKMYIMYECLYPQWDSITIRNKTVEFREHLLLYYMYSDVRCIAGHVKFSELAYDLFHERYKFITTLRDPLSWFTSVYFYNVTSPNKRWKIEESINEFLETPRARELGSFFAGFFSGLPADVDPSSRESVESAKLNLGKLHAVGFLDRMPVFQEELRKVLGVAIRIGHENKARLDQEARERAIRAVDMKKLEEINAVNLEIYDYAQARFAPANVARPA